MKIRYYLLGILSIFFRFTNCFKNIFSNHLKLNLNNDYSKKIQYNLPSYNNVIKKINGFYGIIGPNIKINNKTEMYDLFNGDGMIQGVFFDNGELTFIKSMIKTEKFLFEQKYGNIPKNTIIRSLFFIMNKFNKLPNIGGLANTALLNINKKIYALYEMDQPYLLDIDLNNKTINTVGKQYINNLKHFSAHSKHNNKYIESIEYKMDKNTVNFYYLDSNFNIKKSIDFKFNNIPITHDFYSTNKNIYLIDSPIELDFKNIIRKMPLHLNVNKNTFIHVYDKIKEKTITYTYDRGIFLFHYADIKEDNNYIKILAPLYDKFDFSSLDIQGKYRMILINKKNKEVSVIKNEELENYNLDFPISYNNKIVMQNKKNNIVNGFIICKDLKIIKKIIFNNRCIKGEHNIIKINNNYYLIFFSEIDNKNYISLLNLDKYIDIIDIELSEKIIFGFHSIFIKK